MRDDELPELNEDTDQFTPAQRRLQRREIEEYDEMADIDEDDVPFRLPRVEDLDDDALNPAPDEADAADEVDEVTAAEARAEEDDAPPAHPEQFVLVASHEESSLNRAWEAGLRSVVYTDDPIQTTLLAVMAAELRVAREGRDVLLPSAAS